MTIMLSYNLVNGFYLTVCARTAVILAIHGADFEPPRRLWRSLRLRRRGRYGRPAYWMMEAPKHQYFKGHHPMRG